MANRVDAEMDGMEAAASDASLDGSSSEAQCHELAARRDAVLACCEISDPPLVRPRRGFTCARSAPHLMVDLAHVGHHPDDDRSRHTCQHRSARLRAG
jgi:hypothetical protein